MLCADGFPEHGTASMIGQGSRRVGSGGRFAHADVLLAAAVVGVVAMMVLPLPTLLLDLLLTLNISLAVLLLLVATQIGRALRFSTLPTVLLFATLFRLGLNVSSTRLILLQADAGRVIDAFGRFVAGNNVVVGAVIFLILTLIQYVVVARGSERVAEVAARFALDAMPGRQMAIDADLRAGAVSVAEARALRDELKQESQLFGAMDGAMKFVKGDAVAGILITVINIGGGLAIGVLQRGMELESALGVYTVLTVGDGLVSQIPALLVATAAGVMVSRVSGQDNRQLGAQIGGQLLAHPRALALAAGLLALLALLPGLPAVPFAALAVAAAVLARTLHQRSRRQAQLSHDRGSPISEGSPQPPPLSLALGPKLVHCADPTTADGLLTEQLLHGLRKLVWDDLGLPLDQPPLSVDPALGPLDYRVSLHQVPLAHGAVPADRPLVLADLSELRSQGITPRQQHPIAGIRPGLWQLDPEQADALERAGITAVDPPTLLSLHLGQLVRHQAHELIGLQDTRDLLDRLEASHPALVDEVVGARVELATVHRVLALLLEDRVSIRDLARLLEALARAPAAEQNDPLALAARVRRVLGRAICASLVDADGRLPLLRLDPLLEELCRDGLRRSGSGEPRFDRETAADLLAAVRAALPGEPHDGATPVLVTSPDLRRPIQQTVRPSLPLVAVLANDEPPAELPLAELGMVRPMIENTH